MKLCLGTPTPDPPINVYLEDISTDRTNATQKRNIGSDGQILTALLNHS